MDFFIVDPRRRFLAETFPVFWPNLGPEIFAAFFGSELVFQETTSYAVPAVKSGKISADSASPRRTHFRKSRR